MNIFLRRNRLGLNSIRNILSKMETGGRIFRVDLRYNQPVSDFQFSWGVVDTRHYRFNNIINKPEAIIEISNKGEFRKKLYEAGLSMITTKFAITASELLHAGKKLVVRPYNHFGGSNTHLVDDMVSLNRALESCGRGWYASEYIPKVKEFRVFVVQGRVAYVVEKIVADTSEVAWNVHQGGRFENVRFNDWNLRVVKSAIQAFNLTQLDFGAVDVILDENNKPYVLEINSAPAMTSEYWTTCVAKTFDYIVRNGKNRIGIIEELGNWKKFVHPAISEEAILIGG